MEEDLVGKLRITKTKKLSQDIKIIVISKEMLICIMSQYMQRQPKLTSSNKCQDKDKIYRRTQPDQTPKLTRS